MDDTFAIAARLIGDDEDLIQKAVGGVLREAGKKDVENLCGFLDEHAPAMARVTLRYATEKFDDDAKQHYRTLGQ